MALRVLIIDDSSVMRRALTAAIESTPELTLVGEARNGRSGLEAILRLEPDAVVLDVEMPEMDGLEVLEAMRKQRVRAHVIVYSAHTGHASNVSLRALTLGALDCLTKPDFIDVESNLAFLKSELVPRLRALAARPANPATTAFARPGASPATTTVARPVAPRATPTSSFVRPGTAPVGPPARGPVTGTMPRPAFAELKRRDSSTSNPIPPQRGSDGARPAQPPRSGQQPREALAGGELKAIDVVAVAVSTGGPRALLELLPKLPPDFPVPIIVVQHIPPLFTQRLAQLLAVSCKLPVTEATPGAPVPKLGCILANGGSHLVVRRKGTTVVTETTNEPPENGCRPAADVLFRSIASIYGTRALGVVLTGMGSDGLIGSRAMRQAGARIIVQDKASSVVWGMAGIVASEGLADEILPLGSLADALCRRAAVGRAWNGRAS